MQREEQIAKLKQLSLTVLDDHVDRYGETRKKAEYKFGENLYWFTIGFLHDSLYIDAKCVEYGPDVHIESSGTPASIENPTFPEDYILTPGVFSEQLWRKHAEDYARNIHDCVFFVDLIRKNPTIFLNGKIMDMIQNNDFSFLD